MAGASSVVPCVDLRSQGSGPSSIGAAAFHDPVRDGTGWGHRASHTRIGSGERIRTSDLRVMSPTSCHCSTPRRYHHILLTALLSLTPALVGQGSAGREALDSAHPSPPRVATRPVWAAYPGNLPGVLPAYSCESTHLEAHFPLRCFQRFLLPDIATEPAGRPTTPPPAVRPARSSRTRASPLQCSKRSERIETELSHDVLNPARVPL